MARTKKSAEGTAAELVADGGMPALKLRTPKTSELVADHIRGQIVRGELKEGDSLPPEGQLMTTLGISRPTLREAFRILEAENLISVVRGSRSGARVHQPSVDVAARYTGYCLQSMGTTIADLYGARQGIEPFVVRALCRMQNNTEQVATLNSHIAWMIDLNAQHKSADFVGAVSDFHHTLVGSAGNKTLSFLDRLLSDIIARHQLDYMLRNPTPADIQRKRFQAAIRSYQKLTGLIAAKEEEAAVAHWRLHLKNAHAAWAGPGEGERIVDSLGRTG